MARRVYNPVGAKAVKPSPPPPLPASMKPSPSAIRIANAFDVLGKDSSDVKRLVTIVDAKADAAFLSREKKRKEEAMAAERRRDAFPSHQPPSRSRIPPREFQRRSTFLDSQGGRVPVARKQWVPKSQSQSQNGDGDVKAAASQQWVPKSQSQSQKGDGDVKAAASQQWVPKSQSQSQNGDGDVKAAASPSVSDQIQGSHAEEAKNQIQGSCRGYDNYHGQYQQRRGRGRGRGGYQNQGTRRYYEQNDMNNRQELEKQTQGGGAVNEEVIDGKKQVKDQGVNNGAEKSEGTGEDGSTNKSRQNKNGSALRKLKKKKAAGGGESTSNQEVDSTGSSTQNQYTRSYTLKEYEVMKKRKKDENVKKKKDDDQPQPRTVTLDVNREFRRPREDQRFNNGGQSFNNEARRLNNGGQRFNNIGRRYNNRDEYVDEEIAPVARPKPAAEFRLRDSDFPTLCRKA